MAAIVAFVGTAVLAIGLTRAPARSDASLSYELSGQACPTSGLEAWLGLGAASAATAARPGSAGPPGATAHAVLRVAADTKPAGCAEVTAEELRITLPRQARPSFVATHIPVCSQRGHASLSVQAIQARPGIPGYSMTP